MDLLSVPIWEKIRQMPNRWRNSVNLPRRPYEVREEASHFPRFRSARTLSRLSWRGEGELFVTA